MKLGHSIAIVCCILTVVFLPGCEVGGVSRAKDSPRGAKPAPLPPVEVVKPEVFDPAAHPEVVRALEHLDNYEEVVAALKAAAGNWPELALLLIKDTEPADRFDAAWLVCNLTHLERVEVRSSTLAEHVTLAAVTKSWYPNQTIPLSMYRQYVLDPRIGKFEHVTAWRRVLFERFQPFVTEDMVTTARRINEWVSANFVVVPREDRYFGPQPDPAALLRVLRGSQYDVCLLTTGILRAVGVPARLGAMGEWVEFYDGNTWLPLYPMSPAEFGIVQASPEVERSFKPAGRIRLVMLRRGEPLKNTESFALAVWKDGCWAPLDSRRFPITEEVKEDHILISVPEGKYLATVGTRNSNGDVMIQAKEVEVKSDEETSLSFNMDIPLSLLSPEERVVRKLDTLPAVSFPVVQASAVARTESFSLSDAVVENNLVLVFFSLDNEPSKRMVPLIAKAFRSGKAASVPLVFVYLGVKDDPQLREFLSENAVDAAVVLDEGGAIARNAFKVPYCEEGKKFTALPSTMLVEKGGTVVFWEEGYNLNIAVALEEALELLEK